MALINLPITVTFTVIDETGSKAYTQLSAAPTATLADIRTAASALVPLIQACVLGIVQGYSVAASTIETVLPFAQEGSRVERRGVTSWRAANGKTTTVSLPTLDPAIVLSSGRIDEDSAAFVALAAAIAAAPWSDSNGSDIVSIEEAYEVFRSTGKTQKTTDRRPDVNATAESGA